MLLLRGNLTFTAAVGGALLRVGAAYAAFLLFVHYVHLAVVVLQYRLAIRPELLRAVGREESNDLVFLASCEREQDVDAQEAYAEDEIIGVLRVRLGDDLLIREDRLQQLKLFLLHDFFTCTFLATLILQSTF